MQTIFAFSLLVTLTFWIAADQICLYLQSFTKHFETNLGNREMNVFNGWLILFNFLALLPNFYFWKWDWALVTSFLFWTENYLWSNSSCHMLFATSIIACLNFTLLLTWLAIIFKFTFHSSVSSNNYVLSRVFLNQ